MDKIDITLQKKYSDKEIIKRTLICMKPVKNKFILGISLILINIIFNLITPRIVGYYINAIDEQNMQVGCLWSILFFCFCYFGIIVINMILTYIETMIIQKAGQEVIFNLRQSVFEKIESFSYEQLNEIPVGRLVTRVTNDTNSLNELYSFS